MYVVEDRLTYGAVSSVPALRADAGAVLALAVVGAARVAGPLVAARARPPLRAPTHPLRAHAVRAALQRTHHCHKLFTLYFIHVPSLTD